MPVQQTITVKKDRSFLLKGLTAPIKNLNQNKMNKDFEILNDFKGFGNPNGKIWFVGLEEAANFENGNEKTMERYSSEYYAVEPGSIEIEAKSNGKKYTPVYGIMSKIMTGLFPTTNWSTYWRESLLTKNGNEFQMNLYPLGKENLKSWPEFYERKFGFKDKQEYLDKVKRERFPKLFEFWKQHAPEFTICFGIGNIEDFKDTFHLGAGTPLRESNLMLFEKAKILITPFFDNRFMGQAKIDEAIKIIKPLIPLKATL